jgi:outer membrane protein assembly factor BamB
VLELLAAAAVALSPAREVSRLPAREAGQGVAVDARYIYAIDNSRIARYDRRSGRKIGAWTGDPERFPHLNSCAVIGRELVCASSNYPKTPMSSSVEVFDPVRLTHLRSIPLGHQAGSLTWVDRRDGSWWACFANYDGRGGEPGRDHRFTTLVRFDDRWRAKESWTFPPEVLDRFAPRSSSGGAWGADGRLYVTGHDRPEVYVLDVPAGGGVLKLVAIIAVPIEGQAIAFDRRARDTLFGISRARREVVGMTLPPVEGK